MTTTELIALLQSKEFGGATGRVRDINIYIRNGDGSETWVMDNDSHFIVTGAGDGMLSTDIDLTIINSRTLREEEPTDRFAMGTPSVDHAGENDEGEL